MTFEIVFIARISFFNNGVIVFFRDLVFAIGEISMNTTNKYDVYVEFYEASIKHVCQQLNVDWRLMRLCRANYYCWKDDPETRRPYIKTENSKSAEAEINQTQWTFLWRRLVLILLCYILLDGYSLFDCCLMSSDNIWRNYLLFDVRERCSANLLCLRTGANETEGFSPWPSHLFPPCVSPPISPKRNARLINVKGAVVIPWYAFFLSEIHILYTDIIFVKGWPVAIRRYFTLNK